ncbi:MAG: rRNA maturation RNase YbeY [Bacteroidales bacterium]|nr:rRNA maturation RNase YbeY [Bacteroidales bacterium]MBD5240865.1 rRNA maturation RNase YbeY [Barnesiella sp.]
MATKIIWNAENVSLPDLDVSLMENWLRKVAETHGKILGDLCYIFCDDETIIKVNREFLNHDYYTDIITFDYSRRKLVSGDMYISLDTVASNAEGLGVDYDSELNRVIVHGLLHLCGINDKGEGEREIMEAHENDALTELRKLKGIR